MSEEQLERIGQLIDKADNYLEYTKDTVFTRNLPTAMRMDAMATGLKDIRAELLAIFVENGGANLWAERDLP